MTRILPGLCVLLTIVLAASNCWWLYGALDDAATAKFREQMIHERGAALRQALGLLPSVAGCSERSDVLTAAQRMTDLESYDKGGRTWVGWLGFEFDATGALIGVEPTFPLDQFP